VVQETDKIKDYIDAKRGSLERDLHEIEQRVRKAVDGENGSTLLMNRVLVVQIRFAMVAQ
jgi:hypothetical protein